ncbi:MAG: hypothetical protein IPO25_02390 [Saprospiraceae bacterium]|nr:hypothetical protein [Saprospiraceae bacterium]
MEDGKVIEYGADVTSKHNPANNRWITFNPDGTFSVMMAIPFRAPIKVDSR